jgi:excisionase family DNA binding protein
MEKEEGFLTVPEAAKITKLGKSTLRRLCDPKHTSKKKVLPSFKIGGRIRIKAADLFAWLEEQRRDV